MDSSMTQPNIRRWLEPSEDKKRAYYRQATKSVYLKIKTLHRKKLSLATNMHHIKKLLFENKFPLQGDFNSKIPMSKDQTFRNNWTAITNKCKHDLTNLFLQDLNNKYQTTETEIDANIAQLQEKATNSQYVEIKGFLQTNYKQAMTYLSAKQPRNSKERSHQQAKEEDNKLRGDNSDLEEHQSKIQAKVTLNHY